MQAENADIATNSLRGIVLTLVVYSFATTGAVVFGSNLLLDIALVNVVHGGLLAFFIHKHATATDGAPAGFYVGAVLLPVIAGAAYYLRYRSA
ncbi:hypothetical protein [Haloarchaeobius sp. DYHT-AS-18]|uniref:hypothetical protein n=1 Tax=Haloarchaeobius sp. DYHT-AS-18 TaxID=3446117 RepID=UPI003EC006D7